MASAIKHICKTFQLQHDQSDCGVAGLLSIINYHKGTHTLEKLRQESGTSTTGTTLLGLYQCAENNGFDVQGVELDFKHLRQQQQPCLLHVVMEDRLQHYVVYYGEQQSSSHKSFLIGDPAKGIVKMNEAELAQIWKSKAALLLKPNAEFVYQKAEQKNKWQWFRALIETDVNILIVTIVLGLIIAVAGLFMAVFSQKLIDDILPSGELERLILGLMLLFIILLFKSAFTYLRQHFVLHQSKAFNERITGSFLHALFYLPKSFFDHRKTGDMTARLNDTQRIQKNIAYVTGTVFVDILVIGVTLIFLFNYSAPIALLCLAFIPVIVFTVFRFITPIKRQQQQVMAAYARTESSYVNHIQGVAAIKENNREDFFASVTQQVFGLYLASGFHWAKQPTNLCLSPMCLEFL
ncbi:cysteine peptidase family C39 domain-containing protein [Pontibacter sp. MBLB2868]|uniref:cysteine peptidase family C39 domain-containing protein n=1 Tax=Pontibacter sp. MBLB2868 TaxID=3451555 RepID=UPI003F751622